MGNPFNHVLMHFVSDETERPVNFVQGANPRPTPTTTETADILTSFASAHGEIT